MADMQGGYEQQIKPKQEERKVIPFTVKDVTEKQRDGLDLLEPQQDLDLE